MHICLSAAEAKRLLLRALPAGGSSGGGSAATHKVPRSAGAGQQSATALLYMNVACRPYGRATPTTSHGCSRRRSGAQQASRRSSTRSRARPAREQQEPEADELDVSLRQERGRGEAARLVPVVDETGLQRRQDSSDEAQLAAAAAAAAVHRRLLRRLRLADMTAMMGKAQPELVAIALGEQCPRAVRLQRLAV